MHTLILSLFLTVTMTTCFKNLPWLPPITQNCKPNKAFFPLKVALLEYFITATETRLKHVLTLEQPDPCHFSFLLWRCLAILFAFLPFTKLFYIKTTTTKPTGMFIGVTANLFAHLSGTEFDCVSLGSLAQHPGTLTNTVRRHSSCEILDHRGVPSELSHWQVRQLEAWVRGLYQSEGLPFASLLGTILLNDLVNVEFIQPFLGIN